MVKENGALGKKFDAYHERYQVTESININSLACHHIWSTIKTLLATLPETSSVDRGLGLLEPFLPQIWISFRGLGRITGLGSCGLDLGSGIGGGATV